MNCPLCDMELALEDSYGNIKYALESIGKMTDGFYNTSSLKFGDIYRCHKCDNYWHTNPQEELQIGYPC